MSIYQKLNENQEKYETKKDKILNNIFNKTQNNISNENSISNNEESKSRNENAFEKDNKHFFYQSESNFSNNINISNSDYSLEKKDDSYSTLEASKIFNSLIFFNSNLPNNNKIPENQFNSLRNAFYEKHKLYDIPLSKNYKEYNFPPKYKINIKCFAFLYENCLTTFPVCISGFLFKEENKNISLGSILDNESKYMESLGLFFCGRNIEIKIERGIETKKCLANQFICKKCIDINRKLYNIKSKFLININGRVSKINKGKYHCFGHFLIGNVIEDCINTFSCNACKILDQYSMYYCH